MSYWNYRVLEGDGWVGIAECSYDDDNKKIIRRCLRVPLFFSANVCYNSA